MAILELMGRADPLGSDTESRGFIVPDNLECSAAASSTKESMKVYLHKRKNAAKAAGKPESSLYFQSWPVSIPNVPDRLIVELISLCEVNSFGPPKIEIPQASSTIFEGAD